MSAVSRYRGQPPRMGEVPNKPKSSAAVDTTISREDVARVRDEFRRRAQKNEDAARTAKSDYLATLCKRYAHAYRLAAKDLDRLLGEQNLPDEGDVS